uniref:Uncharacterized protein n=1 Tax=Setaria digitata TaxID=48799 RepID=A0A915PGH6_9BILA
MSEKLFGGNYTVAQVTVLIIIAILITLSLVIALNCCIECCYKGSNNLQKCDEEDERFFDKEYYDEICTLLYRHNQMEMKQIEEDLKVRRKIEPTIHGEPIKQVRMMDQEGSKSGRLFLSKDDLEKFKIDHNVEIKDKTVAMTDKRRTWIGIEDEGKFEPVQMPVVVASQGIEIM